MTTIFPADPFSIAFWPGLLSSFISAALLAYAFFLLREQLFSLPRITDLWECELTVLSTAYNPYAGMKTFYNVCLVQSATLLSGVAEKTSENSAKGPWAYVGKHRARAHIQGRIEKNITKSDLITIIWNERGEQREFSTMFELKISGSKRDGNMVGRFYTTAGECSGFAHWRRLHWEKAKRTTSI